MILRSCRRFVCLAFWWIRVLTIDRIAIPNLVVQPMRDQLTTMWSFLQLRSRNVLSFFLCWSGSSSPLLSFNSCCPAIICRDDVNALCFFWHHYFSLVTPLKGFPFDFTFMKRPFWVFRFTACPLGVLVCERFRTAPLRPPPFGPFVAMVQLLSRYTTTCGATFIVYNTTHGTQDAVVG